MTSPASKAVHAITELDAGRWLIDKARSQAKQHGTQRAALNLKKQGVPFGLALRILTGSRRATTV